MFCISSIYCSDNRNFITGISSWYLLGHKQDLYPSIQQIQKTSDHISSERNTKEPEGEKIRILLIKNRIILIKNKLLRSGQDIHWVELLDTPAKAPNAEGRNTKHKNNRINKIVALQSKWIAKKKLFLKPNRLNPKEMSMCGQYQIRCQNYPPSHSQTLFCSSPSKWSKTPPPENKTRVHGKNKTKGM